MYAYMKLGKNLQYDMQAYIKLGFEYKDAYTNILHDYICVIFVSVVLHSYISICVIIPGGERCMFNAVSTTTRAVVMASVIIPRKRGVWGGFSCFFRPQLHFDIHAFTLAFMEVPIPNLCMVLVHIHSQRCAGISCKIMHCQYLVKSVIMQMEV